MSNKYTITIKGPEGTEIWEGDGLLMFLQRPTDTGYNTQIIGHHVNDSLLPEAMVNSGDLLPVAFAAVGIAIGKRLCPAPNPLEAALKAAIERAASKEDE